MCETPEIQCEIPPPINAADHLKLVEFVLNRRFPTFKGGERDAMREEGIIGLLKAVDTFETSKGYEFSTWAIPKIRFEILTYLRKLESEKKRTPVVPFDLDLVPDDEPETTDPLLVESAERLLRDGIVAAPDTALKDIGEGVAKELMWLHGCTKMESVAAMRSMLFNWRMEEVLRLQAESAEQKQRKAQRARPTQRVFAEVG